MGVFLEKVSKKPSRLQVMRIQAVQKLVRFLNISIPDRHFPVKLDQWLIYEKLLKPTKAYKLKETLKRYQTKVVHVMVMVDYSRVSSSRKKLFYRV